MQRALLAGDKKTGVCIMKLGEGVDDGDIIKSEEIEITEKTDIEYLHDTLAKIGGKLLLEVLDKIENIGKVAGVKQDNSLATYAKKIEKTEGKIDWAKTADEIDRQIRALWSYPGVYFDWQGERIKILRAKKIIGDFGKSKEILDDKLTISCNGGAIRPLIVQRSGKKPMKVEEFLRGFKNN
jgi:methionyl-tRNA formyltransferase